MSSIFEVSGEEAKRIRNLHEQESKNKKIDSTLLNEQPMGQCGCGGGASASIPQGGSVGYQPCPGAPNLLNPFPCATIDGQIPNNSHIGQYVHLPVGDFCGKVTSVGSHTLPSGSVSCPPTPLTLGTDCDNCDTLDPTGGQTSVNCNNGNCITIPGTSGQFATMAQCQQVCEQQRYDCIQGQCTQTPNGIYTSLSDCENNCDPLPNITFNCNDNGSCVPVQGSGGQYMSLQACNADCSYEGNWACREFGKDPVAKMAQSKDEKSIREQAYPTSGHHCVKDPNGPYTTKAQCESNCPEDRTRKINCINCEEGVMTQVTQLPCPQGFAPAPSLTDGPCVECQNGNCVNVGWGYGQGVFNSMAQCQQVCVQQGYDCVNNQCVQQSSGGQFPTQLACQQSGCGQVLWECDPANGCSQTPTGTYQSQQACEAACCNDIIANYGWAQNHPNATANQACQRLFNEFGSATPGPQPVFSDNCKYEYLMNIVNTGGGCGNTNFMNLLEGFAGAGTASGNNGCYGNPASGCDASTGAPYLPPFQACPHQNSICGKKAQFCNNVTNYQAWWKCAWATDFALGLVQGPTGPPYSSPNGPPCNC